MAAKDGGVLAWPEGAPGFHGVLIEALAEGVVFQDANGVILASNTSAARILQMTQDELEGRTSLDPEWRSIREDGSPFPGLEHPSMVALRTGEPQSNVIMGIRRGGDSTTWVSINARPLFRDGSAIPQAVVVSFFDVTASKAMEVRLRAGEERYRSLFENAMDGVLLTRPNGAILAANPAACRLLGLTEDELMAAGRARVVDRDDPRLAVALEERGRTGRFRTELTFVRSDGSKFPAEVSSFVFRDSSGEDRTSMFFRDVTERHRLERLKDDFISSVSHELRTPLTSIRGALSLLAHGVAGDLPQTAREYVVLALANSERLIRLVNDLLDLESIQWRGVSLELGSVDAVEIVRAVVATSGPGAASSGVGIDLDEGCATAIVRADEGRLAQVLLNLMRNAVKFSAAGQRVTVATTLEGNRVRVSVRDRGPGVPPSFRDRIFQRFAQADTGDTRKPGSSGLGLSISKALIEAMGGEIGFEDAAEGRGAVFFFRLPLVEALHHRTRPPGS